MATFAQSWADENTCNGKVKYSKHEAGKAIFMTGKFKGKDMRMYQCDECHQYHLTKKYGKY